ncbi:hypothetical protein [Cellulomonas sp. Root137]|uniref:hypothetical protein n=1 Tax=unclassified Cellulomonas TaxID=2620175 RepID=UPI0006F6FDF5|nr:hypothetical protein [Cellulomonas sp. Root137]KQY47780.1 hypothetical protein ASD18_10975 [Cellulomonas sp. Root137]KRD44892.1 hypothetical protein ASE38_12730 [Cellulomonas sp. Root930]
MVLRPQWEWRFDGAGGAVLDRPVSPVFTTQYDAEQWLGEHWRTLAAQGVQAVHLLHEGSQATPTITLPLI